MEQQNKLQDMIRISLENIRAMVDANTVVGTPIETPSGTTIIPISKVSVGYASGGVDFASKTGTMQNFGGGGGTGLSIQPVCFLSVSASGRVEMLPVSGGSRDTIDRIADFVERAPELITRVKEVFAKNREEDSDEVIDEITKAAADAAERAGAKEA